MKIIVLNGSPKGNISVTMQYIKYIQKKFKQHDFKIINISQRINQIENNQEIFNNIINDIESSDGVVWAFPLYVYTVHSNYQRFIELIFERDVKDIFKGKYTAILTTSIHFYDHTAINYMNSICDDLNMNYVDYFSLHMYDLENEDIRKNLNKFISNYITAIESRTITIKNYSKINYSPIEYIPQYKENNEKISNCNKKIVIITDSLENTNLKNMIHKFKDSFLETVDVLNLEDVQIKGSCLGCLKCAYNYKCTYDGKDEFRDLYNKLKRADIIVFAGSIKYRYLSSTWKKFFDRAFFNTHTPSLSGKQIGFIIAGPLNQIPNLKQILESYIQWQGSNLVGFITDEYSNSMEINNQLFAFSNNIIKLSKISFKKPNTFLGVAGMKIFRDEIWGPIRFPFIADYKAYKSQHMFDFPHKNFKSRIINFILILLSKIPIVRTKMYSNQMKYSMIEPLIKYTK